MRPLILLFFCTACYLSGNGQGDEQTFVVKAKPRIESPRDTMHKALEIHWRLGPPMHDGQEQEVAVNIFREMYLMEADFPFSYCDSFSYQDNSLLDSIDYKYNRKYHPYNYKSLDITIAHLEKTKTYHCTNNHLDNDADDAFSKMKPRSKIIISLHRTTRLGEEKTDTITYHIVSLARGWKLKQAHVYYD